MAADMSVLAATERELASIAERDPELAQGAVAAGALAMARLLDSDSSATSKSMCQKELRETMGALREMVPKVKPKDGVNELADRRAARRRSAATGS